MSAKQCKNVKLMLNLKQKLKAKLMLVIIIIIFTVQRISLLPQKEKKNNSFKIIEAASTQK
jgi:hypothetical protein